jgi:hypothetical protein
VTSLSENPAIMRFGSLRGFVNHYNVRAGKIDCASPDTLDLLDGVKSEVTANPISSTGSPRRNS